MTDNDGLRYIDSHLARFLALRSGLQEDDQARFEELVQQLSVSLESGHSCLHVVEKDRQLLGKSHLVSGGELTPLVLSDSRLYFHRYYQYEKILADNLCRLAGQKLDLSGIEPLLDGLFGAEDGEENRQRAAAKLALERSLCLVSGGPGTGKTTTVVRILALLLQHFGHGIRIALAAPTGKAAMRLQESIGSSLHSLDCDVQIKELIPVSAMTLHRLLGVIRNSPRFRHDSGNPLPWDVLVIDEASMVDLALMSKTVVALKQGSRLILLGDKDQLASVESGAVLADCIDGLPENTVELTKTWRFNSAIKQLASHIRRGEGGQCWEVLLGSTSGDIALLENDPFPSIGERYGEYMAVAQRFPDCSGTDIFQAFRKFQVLCATRQGPRGVEAVNRSVELSLARFGYPVRPGDWYHGRPVMMTRNDYTMDLYNGDVGICLRDPVDGQLKVWFEQPGGALRHCPPFRLQTAETVYGMTIHKSQGSEFAEVLVMLPEKENRVLNRQLLYTAVTRAKDAVQIVATKEILLQAVRTGYERSSGLASMLKGCKKLYD